MTTKAVIHAKSAVPMQTKRTVLSQEMLRILLHCSRYLTWDVVSEHINKFMKKLQYSGYTQPFRYNVYNSAKKAFQTTEEKENLGTRPINRTKDWRRNKQEEQKLIKKRMWYKNGGFDSVLFVPSTPNGELKNAYQREIMKSGHRIKVVEKSGTTLKRQLQVSNPFRPQQCGRDNCFVCSSGGTGNCYSEGVTYEIDCEGECNKDDEYRGESGGNGFTRGLKHLDDLRARNVKNSPLWRHCRDVHNGEMQRFKMRITGTFRNDAMLRQITEAVQIDSVEPGRLMNTRTEWNITRVPRAAIV